MVDEFNECAVSRKKWCQTANRAVFLLSTNDKTIKFWKVQEKKVKKVSDMNIDPSKEWKWTYRKFKQFFDGETFISADDLRINLWNLEISNQSFNIANVKPANMEDLTEVITSAEFHPTHCNTLAYSSSKGSIRLVDLRQSALCDSHAKLFEEQEAPGSRSFFTEIIASILDIKFARKKTV
ncbi:serine/threonine protein phosphatase 2A 55 kDa regulatory subunit B beta isoform [Lathyrus oleraceus]|uniref:Serine/threonine-protein phosphatase 2A 55 kDa regulatory subunit B n=1 Tax=Pisum sativum TaxID=3888 RepID=A0A9D4WV76_PEA|nr:serine/threonine protein phosphatase 2A 55 kDa regulatory subunit B beta isoform-like [Pisum sativum]KAI5408529.1 hypothetical protein KIW84_054393 [Pisum sativum]